MDALFKVRGSKSSTKANGAGGVEQLNTLRSNTVAITTELLGEGECVGLVTQDGTPVVASNGGQAIFLDYTPVQNSDNSYNFLFYTASGAGQIGHLFWQQSLGLPDGALLYGSAQTMTPVDVSTPVLHATPITRTIVDPNVDSVNVVIQLPALVYVDTSNGNVDTTSVSYTISVRPYGGSYVQAAIINIIDQKCTSPYQRMTNVLLPVGGAPWDIMVTRLTADSGDTNLQNLTTWDSYFEVIQGKFLYPNKFIVSLFVDTVNFGTQLPARAFRVKGLKTNVPSNWDSVTRVYTGIWDGTFVKAWHNNPAWVFYDLLVNNRYGIGEFIDATRIDKWGLYRIAQYCDAMIPSGVKDGLGNDILEPRYAFNGVINNRDDAQKVLQMVASSFRGMAYWSLGQVFATADMPTDPIMTFSPANVIKGHFTYSGTAMKARHSIAAVTWADPTNFYQPAIEFVQSDSMLQRFGLRQIDVVAPGCTSRGQAHRFGKWILDTEQYENETVTFEISWDGYVLQGGNTLQPGNIILVADPRKTSGVRIGGRLAAIHSTSQIVLDAPFAPAIGQTYQLTVVMPNATIETHPITNIESDNITVNLTTTLSMMPTVGCNWVIQGTDINPRQFRVLAVQESDVHVFKITALFNDPGKYVRVEENIAIAPVAYTRPSNTVLPVTNITVSESRFFQDGVAHSRLTVSWSPAADFLSSSFSVTANTPRGFTDFGTVTTTVLDISDGVPGDWTFYVTAIGKTGITSAPTSFDYIVLGWAAVAGPTVGSLALLNPQPINTNNFVGTAPTVTWVNSFPTNTVTYVPENIVRVYDGISNVLLRTEQFTGTSYTYTFEDNLNDGGPRRSIRIDVTATGQTGIETTPASITVTNPTPVAVTPTLSVSTNTLQVSYVSTDPDFAGAQIWASQTSGFDPTVTTPAYDGPDTSVSLYVTHGTWYVRVGAYDKFGKSGLIVGPEVSTAVDDITDAINAVLPALTNVAALTYGSFEDIGDQVASILSQIINNQDQMDSRVERTHQLLAVQFGSMSATLGAEQTARIEADYAEAIQRQALQATVSLNSAAIVTEEIVRAASDSAMASSIASLTTTVGSNTATLSTVQTSVNGISIQYGVIGTIDGITGGFLFTGVGKLDGSVSYNLEIQGNVIVDGSITASKLAVSQLTAISANFGTATVNGTISSQNGKMIVDFANNQMTFSD